MTESEEVSIKVHCVVSCLCEVIRRETRLDYRPFYLGLWDADFDVTDQGEITYYQHDLDHSHYYKWYERLFGVPVIEWYNKSLSKRDNLSTLLALIDEAVPGRYIMAQIDMSYLPERENKFHQRPFPHFLILAKSDLHDRWLMLDPDFRWEGTVSKEQVVEAFLNNPFGGGFYVDAAGLSKPTEAAIDQFYREVFTHQNELTSLLLATIPELAAQIYDAASSRRLSLAVKQLPVIAIRKYSYEHALMFFMDEVGESDERFDEFCDLIEQLVQGYNNVQYLVMKMAMVKRSDLLPVLVRRLEEMDGIESRVKREVERLYQLWYAKNHLANPSLSSSQCFDEIANQEPLS